MKMTTLVMTLLMALPALASESFNFSYFGNEGRNRVYLSCYYAENAVDEIMNELGAENVDTRCTGGIDYGMYTPVNITVKYDLNSSNEVRSIQSDFNYNCYFDTKFIKALVKDSPRLTATNSNSYCFSSDSQYSFDIKID